MIRQMQKNRQELKRVCEIWLKESFFAHNFVSDNPQQFWRSKKGDFLLETIDADGYVWEEDGVIKGFMTMKNDHILELFVDSVYQNKGIGTALMNLAKKTNNSLKTNVYEKNQQGIQFYEKESFTKIEPYIEDFSGQAKFKMIWKKQEH